MQGGSSSAVLEASRRRRNSDDKDLILGKYKTLEEVPREVTVTIFQISVPHLTLLLGRPQSRGARKVAQEGAASQSLEIFSEQILPSTV